jgi:diadenylate cyclase
MTRLLSDIGWRDALDVTIIAFLVYRMLLILKGTRAARMLVGLLVLLTVSIVARLVPLYTMDWLLHSVWSYIMIALIVLFQPEIRRTLAEMGAAPFLQGRSSAADIKGVEEIVRATVMLAQRQIGALIVLQRDTELPEIEEFGVPLDARVTKELLMSIFHPTSPIHDGAVIVRGTRVRAAGCFLPLSLSPAISKTLGTRHRAAIGLTEDTDAVVVIVSEETGGISLSVDGRLDTHLDMGTLRDTLTGFFADKQPSGGGKK